MKIFRFEVNMRTLLLLLLLLAALVMQSCAAKAQDPPGGTEIFKGHYVWESHGYFYSSDAQYVPPGSALPARVDLLESGVFDADGAGHGTQCSIMANGIVTMTSFWCHQWTYSLSGWKGQAESEVGDKAWIFCSETGRTCYMIDRRKDDNGSWSDKLERE